MSATTGQLLAALTATPCCGGAPGQPSAKRAAAEGAIAACWYDHRTGVCALGCGSCDGHAPLIRAWLHRTAGAW